MTQGAFIEYLLANECFIYQEIPGRYYKWRNKQKPKNMSGMPLQDNDKELRPVTICQICHNLDIGVPEEVKHAEEVIAYIKKQIENDKNNQAS